MTLSETIEPVAATLDYARIGRAIDWLSAHYLDQPRLSDVAAAAGLSEAHLQRLFTRHVGVSPKKFVQYLTLDFAKERLGASESVLDAALDAGLSGPGRLHDLFVGIEAMSPGEWKARGAGLTIRYGWHPSPFGDCLLMATERGLCGLAFALDAGRAATLADLSAGWERARLAEDTVATQPYAERAFGGGGSRLDLVLRGTPFQLKVWEALLRIPSGALVTYEGLAARIGKPGAARAVAGAVGANPISWLIPCHRVIRGSGIITGYRWGPARKRALLAWEAAQAEAAA